MLEIKTVEKGAELISAKVNGKEMIHDGESFWNRHNPVLFPIVGKLKEGKTIINNQEFFMGQHGFARDMKFTKIGQNKYLLKSNNDTLTKFPYKFELYIEYEIKDNKLKVKYRIVNTDDQDIYFGIGAHPAFKCEYAKKEVYLEFEKNEENVEIYQLQDGLIDTKKIEPKSFIRNNIMKIDANTFKNDAIILKNLTSKKVKLIENNKEKIELNFQQFKYLGIWSKPDAPFICIEPWMNTADTIDSEGIFKNKEDIISLKKNEIFKAEYEIKFAN